ncbi:MAG: DUF393 domain-containing protein [Cellvibrionaceae bacterium]
MKSEIMVIYDKECPICNHFACSLKDHNDHVELINGREQSELRERAESENLNIDTGSVVYRNGKFYHGAEAFYLLVNHSEARGLVGIFNRTIFRFKPVAFAIYPFFVFIRKILLKALGKPLIHESLCESSVESNSRSTVYYNSACPVCDVGVKTQRKKTQGCNIQWKDVHTDLKARENLSSDIEFVRKRLHVVTESGELKVGIDAFIELWGMSPGERWKARVFSLPVIHFLSGILYNAFAWVLYHWNKFCNHW